MNSYEIGTKLIYHYRYKRHSHYLATEVGMYRADFMAIVGSQAVECEIKISASDLKKDFLKKKHRVYQNIKVSDQHSPTHFYFAVPKELVLLAKKLTERTPYGVIAVSDKPLKSDYGSLYTYVKVIKTAKPLQLNFSDKLRHQINLRMSSQLVKLMCNQCPVDMESLIKVGGIYLITNKCNGRVYVGRSKNIYTRWYQHKYNLRRNMHYNKFMQEDFNKGLTDFSMTVLEYEQDQHHLVDAERRWIKAYNALKNGYNIMPVEGSLTVCDKKYIPRPNISGKNNPNAVVLSSKTKNLIAKSYSEPDTTIKDIVSLTGISSFVIKQVLSEFDISIDAAKGIRKTIDNNSFLAVYDESASIRRITHNYNEIVDTPVSTIIITKHLTDNYPDYKIREGKGKDNGNYKPFDDNLMTTLYSECTSMVSLKKRYNELSDSPIASRASFKQKFSSLNLQPYVIDSGGRNSPHYKDIDEHVLKCLLGKIHNIHMAKITSKYEEITKQSISVRRVRVFMDDLGLAPRSAIVKNMVEDIRSQLAPKNKTTKPKVRTSDENKIIKYLMQKYSFSRERVIRIADFEKYKSI